MPTITSITLRDPEPCLNAVVDVDFNEQSLTLNPVYPKWIPNVQWNPAYGQFRLSRQKAHIFLLN